MAKDGDGDTVTGVCRRAPSWPAEAGNAECCYWWWTVDISSVVKLTVGNPRPDAGGPAEILAEGTCRDG